MLLPLLALLLQLVRVRVLVLLVMMVRGIKLWMAMAALIVAAMLEARVIAIIAVPCAIAVVVLVA